MISPQTNLPLASSPTKPSASKVWPLKNPHNVHTKKMVVAALNAIPPRAIVQPLKSNDEFLTKYFNGIYLVTEDGSPPQHPHDFLNHVECKLNDKVYVYDPSKKKNLGDRVDTYFENNPRTLPLEEEIVPFSARNSKHLEIKQLLASHIADFCAMSGTPVGFLERYGTDIFLQRIVDMTVKYGPLELSHSDPHLKLLPSRKLVNKHILRKANKVRSIAKNQIKWAIANDRFHGTIDGVSKEGDLTSCITATGHWIDKKDGRKSMILGTHAFKDIADTSKDKNLLKGLESENALQNPLDDDKTMSESEDEDDIEPISFI